MSRRYRVTVIRPDGSSGRSDVVSSADGTSAVMLAAILRARDTVGYARINARARITSEAKRSVIAERLAP